MGYLNVIILGILQGITEFLPISSSGHLILAPIVLGFNDQGLAVDALLHLATLLAIIIFFRADLWSLLTSVCGGGDPDHRRLGWYIIIASFPAGIAGLMFGERISGSLRSPVFVAWNLIFWSVVFLLADRHGRKTANPEPDPKRLGLARVLFIGCAQALALFPGTSRSGVTIAAGLFSNLSRTAAARFSFLLGTPIILAAGLHEVVSVFLLGEESLNLSPGEIIVGFLVTFGVGYGSIHLLLKIVERVGLLPFIIYRVVLAVGILVFIR